MITVTHHDILPIYAQVVREVIDAVRRGDLAEGDRLLSIRKLAQQIEVAPNTVARSYSELEEMGIIVSRGRRGSFVTAEAEGLVENINSRAASIVKELEREPAATRTALLSQIVHLLGG